MSTPSEAGAGDGAGSPGQPIAPYLEQLRRSARAGDDPRKILGPLQKRISAMTETFAELQTRTYEGMVDDDDRVIAVVDGRGKLFEMRISPHAMRDMDAGELSRACTDALSSARSAAATAIGETLKQLTGVDLGTAPSWEDPRQIWQRAGRETGWSR